MPGYFPTLARMILTTANNETISDIQGQYTPLSEPAQLAWDWTTDVIFAGNAFNAAQAYSNRAWRYIMSIPPAVHGQDLFCEHPWKLPFQSPA